MDAGEVEVAFKFVVSDDFKEELCLGELADHLVVVVEDREAVQRVFDEVADSLIDAFIFVYVREVVLSEICDPHISQDEIAGLYTFTRRFYSVRLIERIQRCS